MNENQPSTAPPPEPATFSLRGLFLFVTSAGVASIALRVADNGAERVGLAMFFVGVFLTFWFLVTGRLEAVSAALLLFVLGLFISMFLPAVMSGGGPRRRACPNNLKQIGLALLEYHALYGSFPPAFVADSNGKPLYSWRVLILPFLDQTNIRNAIRSDEAWNGANNAKWSQVVLTFFNCPDDPQFAGGASNLTSYLAVVGPHTAWSGTKPRKSSDFKDPSKTILLVEVANSGIHWAEPRDLYIGQMAPGINPKIGQGISSGHPNGTVNILFADGSIRSLPPTTDPKKLAEMLDLDGCNDQAAIDGDSR